MTLSVGRHKVGAERLRRAAWVAGLSAVLLAAGAAPLTAAPAQASRDQLKQTRRSLSRERKDLKNLQRQISNERRRVHQGKQRERSILSEIQAADRRIEDAEDRYAENQRNLVLVQKNLQNIRDAMSQTESSLREMRNLLALRLRALYREGNRGLWRTLATSHTLSEALTRLRFFHMLAAQNANWVERLSLTRLELSRQKLELAERESQARELENESLQALEKIRVRKQEREHMLGRVRDERTAHEQAVQELTTASKRLSALINRLEHKARDLERKAAEQERQRRLSEAAARKAQGKAPLPPRPTPTQAPVLTSLPSGWRKMPWPTRGRVTSLYGKTRHPRFSTYVYNTGIDIAGSIGQNVTAVAPGRVLFAEWFEGYGRMVILDHGNGINTICAHLAKITVNEGQSVTQGQLIGTLGDSGTWKGPTLYFELRLRGQALDPLQWLAR